jgi:hypothetical protein
VAQERHAASASTPNVRAALPGFLKKYSALHDPSTKITAAAVSHGPKARYSAAGVSGLEIKGTSAVYPNSMHSRNATEMNACASAVSHNSRGEARVSS